MRVGLDDVATPVRVIRARRGWRTLNLNDVWVFRELLWALTVREVKVRYRQTLVGVLWVVLQPVLAGVVFAFVFGGVARVDIGDTPYFLFAFAGYVAWSAFGNGAIRASTSLLQNSALITKASFPRLLLPIASVLASLVDVGIATGVLVAGAALYGLPPRVALLLLPVWLLLLSLLALAVGLISGALMVKYRDVQYVLPVMLQLLLYASPVGYPVSAVPKNFRKVVLANPLSALLEAARGSVLGWSAVSGEVVMYSIGVVAIVLAGALFVFRSLDRGFADVI